MAKDQRATMYTHSKYAFLVLQAHAAIWKEGRFLASRDSPTKHGTEIAKLLEAPACPTHSAGLLQRTQEGDSQVMKGIRAADAAARQAAPSEPPSQEL